MGVIWCLPSVLLSLQFKNLNYQLPLLSNVPCEIFVQCILPMRHFFPISHSVITRPSVVMCHQVTEI